jgi:uncharacterized protein DUF3309
MHGNAGCPVIPTAWRNKADPFSGAKAGSIIRQRMCHGDVIETGLPSPEASNALLCSHRQDAQVSIGILLLIVSVLLCTAALPAWPYNRGSSPQPSMSFGLLSALIFVLLVIGRL